MKSQGFFVTLLALLLAGNCLGQDVASVIVGKWYCDRSLHFCHFTINPDLTCNYSMFGEDNAIGNGTGYVRVLPGGYFGVFSPNYDRANMPFAKFRINGDGTFNEVESHFENFNDLPNPYPLIFVRMGGPAAASSSSSSPGSAGGSNTFLSSLSGAVWRCVHSINTASAGAAMSIRRWGIPISQSTATESATMSITAFIQQATAWSTR